MFVAGKKSISAREQRRINREEVKEKKRQKEIAEFWEGLSQQWRKEREALERTVKPEAWIANQTTKPAKEYKYQPVDRTILYKLFVGYFTTKKELDLTAIRAKENRRRCTEAWLKCIEEEEFLQRCVEGKFRVVPRIEWVVAVEQTEKWADWYIYYLSEDIPKVCPKMFKTCFVYHKESMMYREKYNKVTSRWVSEMFSSSSFKY